MPWVAIETLAHGLGVTGESFGGFARRAPYHFACMVLEPSYLVQIAVTQMWQSPEELEPKAQILSGREPLLLLSPREREYALFRVGNHISQLYVQHPRSLARISARD